MDNAQSRLIAEQDNIQVESFTDIAFEGAWKGRARSFWATAVVGTLVGAAIGAVAPFFPLLAGATTLAAAAGMVGASVAIYAALGMAAGFSVGVLVGATSGAAASVAKEQERREKGKEIEAALQAEPGASIAQPVAAEPAQAPQPLLRKIMKDYVNVPTLLAFAALGAAGGAVMVAAFSAAGGPGAAFLPIAKPVMDVLLGSAAGNATAVAAYSVGVMASFGAIFGINLPKVAGDLTRFTGDMLSGKVFGSQKGPSSEQARKPVLAQTISLPEPVQENQKMHVDSPELPHKPVAIPRPRGSFQELVAMPKAENTYEYGRG